jgi:DNA adenine methylase
MKDASIVIPVRMNPDAKADFFATPPRATAAPVVKWAGGKTKLLPELMKRMPKRYGSYYEPFCGGAALFFAARPPNRAILNDTNVDLMNVYRVLQFGDQADAVGRLVKALAAHARQHGRSGEAYFYKIRDRWNRSRPSLAQVAETGFGRVPIADVTRAAMFIYLNRTCFNGLWRVNRAGEYNVSFGDYANPRILDEDGLRAAGQALGRVDLRTLDYAAAVSDARGGDFVYFDPPYDPVTETANFTGYAAGGFDRGEQERLAELAYQLSSRGVSVMLSNSDTKFIRKIYRGHGFTISRVMCPRRINSNAEKRGDVAELIITGGLS